MPSPKLRRKSPNPSKSKLINGLKAEQDSRYRDVPKLIRSLLNPAVYPHSTTGISLLETHISWIILTGSFAYKIKKPVNFGFIDFTSLKKRKYFCDEELRLNRRYAAGLYLKTVPISGSHVKPEIEGSGRIIEYAVQMHEFSQHCLFSHLADEHLLNIKHIDAMARVVANFHMDAKSVAIDESYGSCEIVEKWCDENFEQLRQAIDESNLPDYFTDLEHWKNDQLKNLSDLIQQRKADGFVRDCHGDLHLANIAFIDNQCTPFDCIEFNEELRCVDTMSEIAFVFMDLNQRGYDNFAWRFLNRYLEITGDFNGLPLLHFYSVYRAMVRAKVEALKNNIDFLCCRHYLNIADRFTRIKPATLICMHGLSASGKSTVASELSMKLGAIQIRSDVERKRLFKLNASADSGSAIDQGIYTQDASIQTYRRLYAVAKYLLDHGFTVIIDATFLQRDQREQFRQLGIHLDIPHFLISCQAPESELLDRIRQRQIQANDVSEAGVEVLTSQLESQQALTQEEINRVTTIINHHAKLPINQVNLIVKARSGGRCKPVVNTGRCHDT